MKILIIDNAALREKHNRFYVYKSTGEFAKELKTAGHQIEFFQFSKRSQFSISDYDLQKNEILFSQSTIYPLKIITYFFAFTKGIRRIFRNDFIYIFYPNSLAFLGIVAWLVGKRFGLYIRGEAQIYSRRAKWLYKKASVVCTVSDAFTAVVNSEFVKPKAFTIRPMISFSDRDIVLDRIYTKTNNFNILFLGRIDADKGLLELLQGVALLKNRSKYTFNLDIVGGGSLLDDFKEIAADLMVSEIVNFRGPLFDPSDIRAAYLKADIYILPTHHEGFPRTLYEAMIFGVPIITTFVGGISAVMKDGYNCLRIDVKSADSIADKLLYAFNNYSEIECLCYNATSTVKEIVKYNRLSHAQHLHQTLTQE